MTQQTAPDHGTQSRYRHHGCRCEVCVDANRAYHRNRAAAIKAGAWQPYVDAEPVRQHILLLQEEGFSVSRIARLSGGSDWDIQRFIRACKGRGRKRNTTEALAARILAIKPGEMTPAMVSAIGSNRRIEALCALGWPVSHTAAHMGWSHKNLHRIRQQQVVRIDSAQAVSAAYEGLRAKRPARNGVGQGASNRVRNMARARNWAPPKYWDERPGAIDDPYFTSEYGLTKADRNAEEARWLVTTAGLPRTEVAARLGMTFGEVDEALAYAAAA
ncbi:hypothetical protein AB0F20_05555 [Streptomyces goshikiensis]|uniref:hypothetical protein n=1 Tax=Streptomyces goshikiensis TaxID=1942 RepID=UPI0033CB2A69